MRLLGAVTLALLLCGCTSVQRDTTTRDIAAAEAAVAASNSIAQANSFAGKAAAANATCAEEGRAPGTAPHADCVRRLLHVEGRRARDLADTLADRAARNHYTCIDKHRLRLVRCYDI